MLLRYVHTSAAVQIKNAHCSHPLFLCIIKWVSGDTNWILSNKGYLKGHACPSPPLSAPKGPTLQATPVSINVLSLLRGAKNWHHNCISAPQLLGSKCTPVSIWRDGTTLCPWHGHSRKRFLKLLTCPNYCETNPTFFLCPWIARTHWLTCRHLELGQTISIFYGQACAKTTGQPDFKSQTYLQTTHASLAKGIGSDRQGQPQPWSWCSWWCSGPLRAWGSPHHRMGNVCSGLHPDSGAV